MPKNEVKQAEATKLADKLTDICNQPFTIISHGDYPLSAKEIIGLIKQARAALGRLQKRLGELEKRIAAARTKLSDYFVMFPRDRDKSDELIYQAKAALKEKNDEDNE